MWHFRLFVIILIANFLLAQPLSADQETPFLVYYAKDAPIQELLPYQVLVFDSDAHPPLDPLLDRGRQVLGYLSLGEVSDNRAYFSWLKESGLLLRENPNWPGSFLIDMRDDRWSRHVLERIIPRILQHGFQGIFLDTLDHASHLENEKPYQGMRQAAIDLVSAIRIHYPDLLIMMNRGYGILPEVAAKIDMHLAESLHTDYDFTNKKYRMRNTDEIDPILALLHATRKHHPRMRFFALDYWDPEERPAIDRLYRSARANGFHPYVATIQLNRIIQRPEEK